MDKKGKKDTSRWVGTWGEKGLPFSEEKGSGRVGLGGEEAGDCNWIVK